MKRSSPLRRTASLRRGPFKRKKRRNDELVKARVHAMQRAEGLCEARWVGCLRRAEHAHHIVRRSQGGRDDPANLLMVCHVCHGLIHANPSAAFAKGHLRQNRPTILDRGEVDL